MVDVKYKQTFSKMIPLDILKKDLNLDGMLLIKKGMRLSIQPVQKKHFDYIIKEYTS
jgi:predicted RNA-binding protein with PUA-like domain